MIYPAKWMAEVSDGKWLGNIMMPGSHDAGMSELHHCAPPIGGRGRTQTQSLSVGQQLLAGARYFDIRVDYDYKRLVTYHRTDAWGCNGQDLAPVLDQLRDFLTAHPTETAILKFSHIRDYLDHSPAKTKKLIDELLDGYGDMLYTSTDEKLMLAKTKLGSVRGKAILVFDYPEYISTRTGRFRYHDGDTLGYNLVVFDVYSETPDYEVMKADQLRKWKEHGGMGQGFFFLLSWTLTPTSSSGSVEELAAIANGNLPNVLQTKIVREEWPMPNVVYIDYVNPATCAAIISYNFPLEAMVVEETPRPLAPRH